MGESISTKENGNLRATAVVATIVTGLVIGFRPELATAPLKITDALSEECRIKGTAAVPSEGTVAGLAGEHLPDQSLAKSLYQIGKVNPGVDLGRVEPGQEINLPECS